MTGAGTSRVAFRAESSFNTPDDTNDWILPGLNVSVGDFSIENNQQRNRKPDEVTPVGSRAGNFRGTLSLNFDYTGDEWHALVPFSGAGESLSGAGGAAPTAEFYLNTTALDDTDAQFESDITVSGAATEAAINYQQGEPDTVDLTIDFGALSSESPADGDIVEPSNADVFTHHGTSISVGGRSQTGAQSATLTLSNLARRQEQQSREPLRYVVGAIEPSFSTDALFTEEDQLTAALGGSTTSVADTISGEASAEFALSNGNGSTVTYELTQLDPQTYSWNALVDPETDLTEPVDYHLTDVAVA